jgi:hypothetical protein
MWDEIKFHAVKVMVQFDEGEEEEAVADTGAAPNIVSEHRLSVEVRQNSVVPGRARLMHSASSHRIKSRGGASLNFKLKGCDRRFKHEWQVIAGEEAPTIIGTSFWARHKAKFDFEKRCIEMTVEGERVQVPFTIGDESQGEAEGEEKEETALYAVEDMVVPPRSGYMVPAKPREGAVTAWEVWAVRPRTEAETEELHRSLERE